MFHPNPNPNKKKKVCMLLEMPSRNDEMRLFLSPEEACIPFDSNIGG